MEAGNDAEEAEGDAGRKLDTILKCLDSFSRGMDSLSKRMDAFEKPPGEEAGENDSDGEETARSWPPSSMSKLNRNGDDPTKPTELAADAEEIENFKAKNGDTRSVAADSVLAEIQSHADQAASAWSKSAPHPWGGERITAYRRRTARDHQAHSTAWKDVDLATLSGQSLRNATSQIFADSIAASSSPSSYRGNTA